MEKRRDDRDAQKAGDEEVRRPGDESQQAAELQIGEDDEFADRSRFEPDPQSKAPEKDPGESR